jgi:uncharacterized membrane protein
MQNPLDKLNQAESQFNQVANRVRNPVGQAQNQLGSVQRTLNRGTSNMIGALCYVTGVVSLLPLINKRMGQDSVVRYHAAHARVLWVIMLILSCTIIGLPVAGIIYVMGFGLAAQAVNGQMTNVPFLSRFIASRGWL